MWDFYLDCLNVMDGNYLGRMSDRGGGSTWFLYTGVPLGDLEPRPLKFWPCCKAILTKSKQKVPQKYLMYDSVDLRKFLCLTLANMLINQVPTMVSWTNECHQFFSEPRCITGIGRSPPGNVSHRYCKLIVAWRSWVPLAIKCYIYLYTYKDGFQAVARCPISETVW